MTERSPTPRPFEDWLTAELHRTAAVADDPRPAAEVAREVLGHRRARVAPRRYRRWTPLLGLAAALLLPAALLVVGSRLTSSTPEGPIGWETVIVRRSDGAVVDVLLVSRDGSERTIRTIDGQDRASVPDPVGYYYPQSHVASTDGWLAVFGHVWYGLDGGSSSLADAWQLFDLLDTHRPARTVWADAGEEPPVDTAAWGPDGRFARMCTGAEGCTWYHDIRREGLRESSGSVRVVVPGASDSLTVEGLMARDLPLAWHADGSAVVGMGSDRLVVVPVGERSASDGVPPLAWRPGPRLVTEGGARLEPDSTLTIAPDGTRSDWRDVRPHAGLTAGTSSTKAVSLAVDGTSVWLLAGDWRRAALVQASSPGEMIVVGNVVSATPPADGTATSTPAFAGLAPDDSLIVIRAEAGYRRFGGEPPIAIVRTSDGAVSMHEGWFAGFVPEGLFPRP